MNVLEFLEGRPPRIKAILRQFYEEWSEWRLGGAKNVYTEPFKNYLGLEKCLVRWLGKSKQWDEFFCVVHLQKSLFEILYDDGDNPFGMLKYFDEVDSETMHLNQDRIDYVENMIKML